MILFLLTPGPSLEERGASPHLLCDSLRLRVSAVNVLNHDIFRHSLSIQHPYNPVAVS